MFLSSLLYVCIAAHLFPAISSKSRHHQELTENFDHFTSTAEFKCSSPQPRLLAVQELLSDAQIYGKAYFPEETVLHRCDRHVGSCEGTRYQCGPTHISHVNLSFKATFLEDIGGHLKGQWSMEHHHLVNHTSCGCVETQETPSKTVVHYHFIEPSLLPSQDYSVPPLNVTPYFPLEPSNTHTGSFYDVLLSLLNSTITPPPKDQFNHEQ